MSGFRGDLDIRDLDGTHFVVLTDLVYEAKSGEVFTVPAGTPTDFASIPRALTALLPKNGRYDRAAVLHDKLYQTGEVPKSRADDLFCEAMDSLGVGMVLRRTLWLGVRMGGGFAWRGHRRRDVAAA